MTAVRELKRLSGKLFVDGEYRDSAAADGFDEAIALANKSD